ncbi:excalibur calcium-binding domain-containing protein [Rhodococcus qingshengii]|uniref:excalibur calcium-binding domain-containing protein n=1 Tax=Rhodococcus qingshengii TaxID=334542 RepID=UPI0035DB4BEE
MKRIIAALAIPVALLLTSCSGSEDAKPAPTTTTIQKLVDAPTITVKAPSSTVPVTTTAAPIVTSSEVPAPPAGPAPKATAPPAAPKAPTVKYSSCADVKKAGAAPLYKGDPGYSTSLDRDEDGVACEK